MMSFVMLLQFGAAFICIFYLSWRFQVELVEAVPVFVCGLVLVLYVLAMLHHLSWIDGIEVIMVLVFAIWLTGRRKEERREFGKACLKKMTQASFITAVFLLLIVVVCTSGKVVSWWDDINFWATDVKALYYLDGFADKYGNVAPEFGDYPPGAQLFKWWFVHLDPHVFREGLAFAGYYVMNLSFMLPLLRRLKSRNIPVMALMAAAFWFLPSIAEVYGYDGFCADLTMACIYGGFLLAVTDREPRSNPHNVNFEGMKGCIGSSSSRSAPHDVNSGGMEERKDGSSSRSESRKVNSGGMEERKDGSSSRSESRKVNSAGIYFYGMRLALYLGLLVLVKSTGFVWALFGLVFLFVYKHGERRSVRDLDKSADGYGVRLAKCKSLAAVAAVPVLTGGSWMIFCLLMRRVTKTTATAVKYMTTDEYGISGYTGEFARAFFKAFVGSPLHKEKSIGIDLTPLGLYLCICAVVVLFYGIGNRKSSDIVSLRDDSCGKNRDFFRGIGKYALMPRWEGRVVLWFSVFSGALFYGVIFLAHITIFATETQYLEPAGMISSIERYGAPFTVGTVLFLAGLWLERGGILFQEDKIPGYLQKYGVYLCFILFVALTAGYRVGYHGLIGYQDTVEEKLAQRADMIGKDEAQFLEVVSVLGKDKSTRVCYIRRGDVPRWVNNSYAAYEASPVSVVYRSVNLDDAPADWMVQEIRASHAAYLYAEHTDADAGAVFDEITVDGAFRCGVLYEISDDGIKMKLTEVSQ